ncbi:nucleotidyltransferase domain-containing protein, partial [Streptomyces glaucescens]|uniref:nucleotidyltransferase domain-containing protein n=2 Tax=Streptomyces TaxID=1883 RepID=UPI00146FB9DF
MPALTDSAFLDTVADRLAALPTVEAVSLGGSRAQGTHRADSDWDLGIYYRGAFDPADLRAL